MNAGNDDRVTLRWNATKSFKEAIAAFFRSTNEDSMEIKGTSMWPALRNAQAAGISHTIDRLLPGRCYGYYFNDTLIVHRFVGIRGGNAVFIGDRGLVYEIVPDSDILCLVETGQPAFLLGMIAGVNSVFASRFLSFHAMRKMRVALIYFLTIGAAYVGKVRKTGAFFTKNGTQCPPCELS